MSAPAASAPAWPGRPGLEVAVRTDVASPAGGALSQDFADIVHLGSSGAATSAWVVFIGAIEQGADGGGAATAHGVLRAAAGAERSPARLLGALDAVVPASATVVALVVPGDGRAAITLATSGQAAPLVLRRHGGVDVIPTAATGERRGDHRIDLGPGDALVIASDGITDHGRQGPGFDEGELTAVLSRCTGFTADVLAERIETAARAFAGEVATDDLTIGVIRVPEVVATATFVSADLPADVSAPGRARRIVTESLAAHERESVLERAVLLASEVVTNAVVHGGGRARIGVEHDVRRVRVSVTDASETRPRRLDLGVDATSGRGIQLLDLLATRWGVEPHPPQGKTVWFELDAGS